MTSCVFAATALTDPQHLFHSVHNLFSWSRRPDVVWPIRWQHTLISSWLVNKAVNVIFLEMLKWPSVLYLTAPTPPPPFSSAPLHLAVVFCVQAANYLDIKGLLDVTCKTVANMIKGKTPEEIRKTFNIKNDFTEEEEAQVVIPSIHLSQHLIGRLNDCKIRPSFLPVHRYAKRTSGVKRSEEGRSCQHYHTVKDRPC